jgi:hypothetical protein
MKSEREPHNSLLPDNPHANNLNDRRSFLKLLAAALLFASLGARSFASAVAATANPTGSNASFSNNIYTRLGVRPVINCVGTWTYLTASLELPEVRAACDAASRYFVDLFELQAAAGRRLAQLSGAESSQTAMVYTTWGDDERLQSILKIAKAAGVPVLLDQAGHIPPYSNLTRLAKTGVDLFCISGGKGLRGPQVSGLLLGRKDLIEAARYNCTPWEGSICRPMKVGKEEIMGVLAALDYWSKPEVAVIEGTWQRQMERIATLVSTVPGVQKSIGTPPSEKGNSYPTLTIIWDANKFGLTANQCGKQLREGDPRIDVWTGFNFSGVLAREQADKLYDPDTTGPNQLQIFTVTLQRGEHLIVGNRIRQVLEKARKQTSA